MRFCLVACGEKGFGLIELWVDLSDDGHDCGHYMLCLWGLSIVYCFVSVGGMDDMVFSLEANSS